MCRRSLDGDFRNANATLLRMLGVASWAELQNREPDLADARDARTDLCRRLLAENEVRGLEQPWRTADGRRLVVRIFAARSAVDASVYEAVVEDVTELRRREDELRTAMEAAKAAVHARSVFLANMSHEIRTPLTSIIGFASVLTRELSGESRRHAEYVAQSGRRLVETMDGVLTYATLESDGLALPTTSVNVGDVARDVLEGFSLRAASRGIDLALDLGGDEPIYARAEPEALSHILRNLVSNAVKFTPAGRVEVRVGHAGTDVVVDVIDTGVGIDAEFLPRVFDPFKQESTGMGRSHEGIGIGLTIARRLAERMGARLEAESVKGQGSRFTLTMMVATPVPAAATDGTVAGALR